ncbi:MAG: hypothetical protein M3P51_07330 [Chloroflexota bacterium]|nr:hypothetical protein [Chloroflexota bacterium]
MKPAPQNVSIQRQAGVQNIDPVMSAATIPDVPVRSLAFLSNNVTDVEQAVVAKLGDDLPSDLRELGALREHVSVAEVAGRPDVFEVQTAMGSSAMAVRVTNLWAETLAEYLNELLGRGYFDAEAAQPELERAQQDWQTAQQRLSEFERESGLTAAAVQLESSESLLNSLAEQRVQVGQNLDNAALLRTAVRGGSAGEATSVPLLLLGITTFTVQNADLDLSDTLPSLERTDDLLAARVEAATAPEQTSSPQVQPILQDLQSLTPQEQAAFLQRLVVALQQKQTQLDRSIPQQQQRYARFRSQLEDLRFQRERLRIDRDAERQLYESLRVLNRQQEVNASIQSEKVSIVGEAVRADRTGLGGLLPPLLGALGGALLGTVGAFLLEFFRNTRRTAASTRLSGARSRQT